MDTLAFAVSAPLPYRRHSRSRHASCPGVTDFARNRGGGANNFCELQHRLQEARRQFPNAPQSVTSSPSRSSVITTSSSPSSTSLTTNSDTSANRDVSEGVGSKGWQRGRGGRLSLGDVQADAIARGGKLLSVHYVNAHTPLKWRCALGHEWTASAGNIRSARSWCPHCARVSRRRTIDDMNALARRFGGACLSTGYVSEHTKLQWKCSEGHTFWLTPNNIDRPPNGARKPSWCKICNKIRRKSSSSNHPKSQLQSTYDSSQSELLPNPPSTANVRSPNIKPNVISTNYDILIPTS